MLSDPRDTGDPIGTYEELIEHNLNPKLYGSCSAGSDNNRGCPAYATCRFVEFRDRLNGMKGPEMLGVVTISPRNTADQKVMSCWDYYKSGLHSLRQNADKNGWVVEVIEPVGPGAKVLIQGSKKLHEKRDPDCLACIKGECHAMQRFEHEVEVPRYVRLGELSQGDTANRYKLGYAERLRGRLREKLEQERVRTAFTSGEPPPASGITVPEHEGPGVPRFNRPNPQKAGK
jgi:hypothetical protein